MRPAQGCIESSPPLNIFINQKVIGDCKYGISFATIAFSSSISRSSKVTIVRRAFIEMSTWQYCDCRKWPWASRWGMTGTSGQLVGQCCMARNYICVSSSVPISATRRMKKFVTMLIFYAFLRIYICANKNALWACHIRSSALPSDRMSLLTNRYNAVSKIWANSSLGFADLAVLLSCNTHSPPAYNSHWFFVPRSWIRRLP